MLSTSARILAVVATVFGFALTSAPSHAGPASDPVQRLNTEIVRIMQNGPKLGYDGRYKAFEPVLSQTFDLPYMAQAAIGRFWATIDDRQRAKVTDTFRRYTTALYASRFDDYNNQRFEVTGERNSAQNTIMVLNRLVRANGTSVGINYLMRPDGRSFRAIDVYLRDAISEIALRRSEFSSVLAKSGVDGLIAAIEDRIKVVETEARSAKPKG